MIGPAKGETEEVQTAGTTGDTGPSPIFRETVMARAVASAAQLAASGDSRRWPRRLLPWTGSLPMLTVATPSSKLSASSWKGRLRPARSNNGQHAHTYDGGNIRRLQANAATKSALPAAPTT